VDRADGLIVEVHPARRKGDSAARNRSTSPQFQKMMKDLSRTFNFESIQKDGNCRCASH